MSEDTFADVQGGININKLTIYTNVLISGFPEIWAFVHIIFNNLIVRIRHRLPSLHGAIYLHQKTGLARHPVNARCH